MVINFAVILLTLFSTLAYSQSYQCRNIFNFERYIDKYSVDTILDYIPAVHGFRFIPPRGTLIANPVELGTKPGDTEFPHFRPTVHWTLGALMPQHYGNNHENSLGAVIVPLRNLVESGQLVNINAYDTFLVGDLKIPKNAIIVIQKGSESQLDGVKNVVIFDPKVTSLRETVDKVIADNNFWSLKLESHLASGRGSALLNGKNINSPQFFSDLLKLIPTLGFGDHINGQHGLGSLFGILDQSMQSFGRIYFRERNAEFPNRAKILLLKAVINKSIKKLNILFQERDFPHPTRQAYEENRKKVRILLSQIELPGPIIGKLTWWADPVYVENQVKILANFKPEEASDILSKSPNLQTRSEGKVFWAAYAMNRTALIGIEKAKVEGLLQLFESNLKGLIIKSKKRRLWFYYLAKEVYKEIELNRVNSEVYVHFARNPEFLKAISKYFGVTIIKSDSTSQIKSKLGKIKEHLSLWDRLYFHMKPTSIEEDIF
jgi:hypothetical protein